VRKKEKAVVLFHGREGGTKKEMGEGFAMIGRGSLPQKEL